MSTFIGWLYWNPSKEAFTIPILDRPIAWYGILFVLGFILSYFIIIPVFARFLQKTKTFSSLDIANWSLLVNQLIASKPDSPIISQVFRNIPAHIRLKLKSLEEKKSLDPSMQQTLLSALNNTWQTQELERKDFEQAFPGAIEPVKHTAQFLTDRLCWFIVLGTLIGARLGAVLFYDWSYYSAHPIEIFKVWKGGLASHGGTLGVIIAIYLFRLHIRQWVPSLRILDIMDCVAVPTALAGCFIRLGNFVNQEILGTPTDLPWGVIFGNPIDESTPIPRHPVQLYEALAYFTIFLFLYFLWKKKSEYFSRGMLSGLLLILIFSSRFILEFWKENMESIIESSSNSIQMGQWLSLPFIVLGFYLIWYGKHHSNCHFTRTNTYSRPLKSDEMSE